MDKDSKGEGLNLREYIAEVERAVVVLLGCQREVLVRYFDEQRLQGKPIELCGLVDCRPLNRYREAVQEAVRVLEETRQSFKSRRLEELRRRLERVLAEHAGRKL